MRRANSCLSASRRRRSRGASTPGARSSRSSRSRRGKCSASESGKVQGDGRGIIAAPAPFWCLALRWARRRPVRRAGPSSALRPPLAIPRGRQGFLRLIARIAGRADDPAQAGILVVGAGVELRFSTPAGAGWAARPRDAGRDQHPHPADRRPRRRSWVACGQRGRHNGGRAGSRRHRAGRCIHRRRGECGGRVGGRCARPRRRMCRPPGRRPAANARWWACSSTA